MTIEPDPRIKAYIDEVEQPGIPYVSRSHVTLHQLNQEHGQDLVHALINDYFTRKRNNGKAGPGPAPGTLGSSLPGCPHGRGLACKSCYPIIFP